MRLKYDRSMCQGHNRCYMLAPELFDTDDEGYAVLRLEASDGAAEVPSELEDKAQLCADNCPEYAITVT
ncbi:MAG: ferredoxin [Acidimicrobiales bacterium]